MKITEITDKDHFVKMLKNPTMAKVEKRLDELVPTFKARGWHMEYEADYDNIANEASFRVMFTLTVPWEVELPELDPDSNRLKMNVEFPDIASSSVINRREQQITIILYPYNDSRSED